MNLLEKVADALTHKLTARPVAQAVSVEMV
jgi:hypothetical protein